VDTLEGGSASAIVHEGRARGLRSSAASTLCSPTDASPISSFSVAVAPRFQCGFDASLCRLREALKYRGRPAVRLHAGFVHGQARPAVRRPLLARLVLPAGLLRFRLLNVRRLLRLPLSHLPLPRLPLFLLPLRR